MLVESSSVELLVEYSCVGWVQLSRVVMVEYSCVCRVELIRVVLVESSCGDRV